AIAYGLQQAKDQTVVVYDLGGGTFDVTVITIRKGAITVVATDGDYQLGGGDWDDAIVRYFAECFENEKGTPADDVLKDMETYQSLLLSAEKCKKMLSTRTSVEEKVVHEADRI